MNASFVFPGIPTLAGVLLLRHTWPARRLTTVALVLWIVAGLARTAAGLLPENTNITVHTPAALNAPIASVAILLLSLAIRRSDRAVSTVGIVLAAVGLLGTGFPAAQINAATAPTASPHRRIRQAACSSRTATYSSGSTVCGCQKIS
jgi:hypothetical membrane protein